MTIKTYIGKLCFILLITSCASTVKIKDIKSLTTNAVTVESEEEKSLFIRSNRLHQKFVKKGLIVRDINANRYINDLGKKIAPTFEHEKISLNFYILKDASINAFALPNGNIYLNAGLITRLSSEDQLAFVIAHEISHVILRHGLKGLVDRKNTIAGSHVADLFLMGTGLIYLATITDLASYSRGSEIEADEYAIKYLFNTNVDINESAVALDSLQEVKYKKEGMSIWSSHPDTQSRISSVKSLIKENDWQLSNQTKSIDHIKEYEIFRYPFVEKVAKIRLRNKQFELAEDMIVQELEQLPKQALLHYYLAEAQRLKGSELNAYAKEYAWLYDESNNKKLKIKLKSQQADFLKQAKVNYQKAMQLDGNLSLTYRGLGLLALYEGDKSLAKEMFEHYLTMDNVKDSRYIKSLLKNI